MRIGIYPGTFDPLHEGHVAFALAALEAARLDKVYFLPERVPRYKKNVSTMGRRLKQISAELMPHRQLQCLALDSDHLTLPNVMREMAAEYKQHQICMLIGSDLARALPQWDDKDSLFKNHEFCIGLRGNDQKTDIEPILKQLQKDHSQIKIYYVETPYRQVSSTQKRAALR